MLKKRENLRAIRKIERSWFVQSELIIGKKVASV
jgi:hypothetical protein